MNKLPNIREFEAMLRREGFTKSQAVAIASRGYRALIDRCGEGASDMPVLSPSRGGQPNGERGAGLGDSPGMEKKLRQWAA